MTDWLARFRALTAGDPRFGHGDNSDNSDNRVPGTELGRSEKRENNDNRAGGGNSSPFVTNVSFVTNRAAKQHSSQPHRLVDLDWRNLFEERAAIRGFDGRFPRAKAEWLAWRELQNRWHMERGERVPPHLCAGCRRPIGDALALDLIDGNRVHRDAENSCLIRHGERWRNAASRALVACGINQPRGDEE
jgi:hypothetical protein